MEKLELMLTGITTFLIVFVISYFVAQLIRAVAQKALITKLKKKEAGIFVSDLLFYSFIIIGILLALSGAGVNVNAIIAGLGLGGLALGFALQNTISNFVSGVIILITKPFNPGDYLKVDTFEGEVKSINLRQTIVSRLGKSGKEEDILIPNSTIFSSIIVTRRKDAKIKKVKK